VFKFSKKYFRISSIKKIKDWRSRLAAALPAVKRSGQHKNKFMLCIPLLEALAAFWHGTIKKIISMAAWGGIIFFIVCAVGYLT
jgi:hypothetical protein